MPCPAMCSARLQKEWWCRADNAMHRPHPLPQIAKDVYFTDFKRLFEGEKYTNPGAEEIKVRRFESICFFLHILFSGRTGAFRGLHPPAWPTLDPTVRGPPAQDRAAKSKGKVAGDWRPNSPGKKMSGKGTYYGTIGPVYPHAADHDASREGRGKFESSALPNIKTSPAKKGG
eukprot:SAG22_NODE_7292_length_754_cov_1.621374_1_plen_172_part_01